MDFQVEDVREHYRGGSACVVQCERSSLAGV